MTQVHPRINIGLRYIRNTSDIHSEFTYTPTKVAIKHNEYSLSLHLWEGIMVFWTIFGGNTIVKVKSKGNIVGI